MTKRSAYRSARSILSLKACSPPPAWHAQFLEMLPQIEDEARYGFRHLKAEARAEAIQEVTANACQAYERLVKRGKAENATWSSLAKYAIRQVQAGRRVGGSLNVRDVTSRHCQLQNGVRVKQLSGWDDTEHTWSEMILEDRRTTPADVAAFRIDFREFLRSLSRRNRKITLCLARGQSTSWVAKAFHLSPGRVSQIRRELAQQWQQFQAQTSFASAET